MKDPNLSSQASLGLVLLAVLALGALWVTGMPYFFQEVRLLIGTGGSPPSYRLSTVGNTLIAASTALYVANLYLSLDTVGRWATRLAGAGAGVLVVAAGTSLLGLAREPPRIPYPSLRDFQDVISVMVPMFVIWYLVVEHTNRERTAGAYVMWAILCFIAGEIWLAATNTGTSSALISGFHDYWGQAYVLAHVIGYGAFVVAAVSGILFLARHHFDVRGISHPGIARWIPDSWRTRTAMLSAIGVGVPVFALALFLALAWALGADVGFARLKGLWVAGVLMFYGVFLHYAFTRVIPSQRMAWWSVLGLGLTLAAFVATHMLRPDVSAMPSGARSGESAALQKESTAQAPRSLPTAQQVT